jgi:hypothetical protein
MMHCSLCRLTIFDHFHTSCYTGAWMTPLALSLDMQRCCDNSTGPIGLVVWWTSLPHFLYQPVGVMYACMHAAITFTRQKNLVAWELSLPDCIQGRKGLHA